MVEVDLVRGILDEKPNERRAARAICGRWEALSWVVSCFYIAGIDSSRRVKGNWQSIVNGER